ncbi:hypothetical protein BJ996_003123 [Streptomyces phaeogriseichromatogenes]|nr:hypothetical protein [Streptomyces murinus]
MAPHGRGSIVDFGTPASVTPKILLEDERYVDAVTPPKRHEVVSQESVSCKQGSPWTVTALASLLIGAITPAPCPRPRRSPRNAADFRASPVPLHRELFWQSLSDVTCSGPLLPRSLSGDPPGISNSTVAGSHSDGSLPSICSKVLNNLLHVAQHTQASKLPISVPSHARRGGVTIAHTLSASRRDSSCQIMSRAARLVVQLRNFKIIRVTPSRIAYPVGAASWRTLVGEFWLLHGDNRSCHHGSSATTTVVAMVRLRFSMQGRRLPPNMLSTLTTARKRFITAGQLIQGSIVDLELRLGSVPLISESACAAN